MKNKNTLLKKINKASDNVKITEKFCQRKVCKVFKEHHTTQCRKFNYYFLTFFNYIYLNSPQYLSINNTL